MWSTKKYIDLVINCLLFLVAINFLHYGQLFLPVICLILFIDNKFSFKVNNWLTFLILVLFGISFFIFSFKLGFYSTMGFCFPMAYYIGSNILKNDKKTIKKVVYILGFGMALHVGLNIIADFSLDGLNMINSVSHYDIWTQSKVPTTSTAVLTVFVISLLYYLLIHEDSKKYRILGITLFVIVMIYDLALGRRTPIIMVLICLLVSLFLDACIFKNKKINFKPAIVAFISFGLIIVLFALIYFLNLFGLKEYIDNFGIVKKFVEYGLDTGRLDIFFKAIKLMPEHLWGGQEIHDILGIQVHDLWMDTYDYAGIIPFALLVTHSIMFVVTFVKVLKSKRVSNDFKLFISSLFFAITLQLFLEPIMSGSSLFIIDTIIVEACIEKVIIHGKEHYE